MIEVVSLVNFRNPKRVEYLSRSFDSFHRFNKNVRHMVFDSSPDIKAQSAVYSRLGAEVHHMPGATYGARLRSAAEKITQQYFVFLPDDFEWIFPFPLPDAIEQAGKFNVHEVKLSGPGMEWLSEPDPKPTFWFKDGRVPSGEQLVREEDLYVSKRRLFRGFTEQFSLACNLFQARFFRMAVGRLPRFGQSAGQAEKLAYLSLLGSRYFVGYYKLWIPAFHFIDLSVEGDTPLNRLKFSESFREENKQLYNRLFNS